jgi:beta-galactosidase/beta-glucuronidase
MNSWKKIDECLETPWAPGNTDGYERGVLQPLNEYPRPQMVRSGWINLNGLWDYAVSPEQSDCPEVWEGQILVPYALETAASGVKKALLPEERLWYRREFSLPDGWEGRRILLNFEAVDWECRCLINGQDAGFHRGGYLPFSFDITEFLKEGENELILSVWDPTDAHWQQRGKQMLKPRGCFYTATSGIWQTVWMEALPLENHIEHLKMTPDVDKSVLNLSVRSRIEGHLRITVLEGETVIAEVRGSTEELFSLKLDSPRLWSPEDPYLYNLKVELTDGTGDTDGLDQVQSYFAMRKISRGIGSKGHPLFLLNDRPVFLHGPLDQGYWPESGMTPPSEEAILFDLEKTKAMGFNMSRKHIKVEPRRWYYHADRLGLMVIQDMISSNRVGAQDIMYFLFTHHRKDTTQSQYRSVGRAIKESRDDFERELFQMVDHLHNHPSIVIWCPFNEAWGQFDASRIGRAVKDRDSSRLMDEASGWNDQWGGDFLSRHTYVKKLKKPKKKDKRIFFISEYGGYNLQLPGHLWDEKHKFGYRSYKNREALAEAYESLIRDQIIPLVKAGLGGAVYTQISDVEIESNGFYSYDRKICKLEEELVNRLNKEIDNSFRGREEL